MWFKTLHQLVSSQILLVAPYSRCIIYRRLDYVSIRSHNYLPLRFARKSTTFLRHTQIFVLKNAKYFSFYTKTAHTLSRTCGFRSSEDFRLALLRSISGAGEETRLTRLLHQYGTHRHHFHGRNYILLFHIHFSFHLSIFTFHFTICPSTEYTFSPRMMNTLSLISTLRVSPFASTTASSMPVVICGLLALTRRPYSLVVPFSNDPT